MGNTKHPPNITIDTDISVMQGLELEEVDACLEGLGLPPDQHERVRVLTEALCLEVRGEQDRVRMGEFIDAIREISEEVYVQIAKPVFITFLRKYRRA